ncbi:MAG TPA: DUF1801 domain-containing protein, partial [Burkholderiaceae bacterium]
MVLMQKVPLAPNPAAYLAALSGWQQSCVEALRAEVLASAVLDERMKWGNLVYFSNGPVLMIRAEEHRLLFGFWRGQSLRHIEPRLKPGGKYQMAALELAQNTPLDREIVR